jgi:hypothetical protein
MRPYRVPIIRIPVRQQIPPPKLSMETTEKKTRDYNTYNFRAVSNVNNQK